MQTRVLNDMEKKTNVQQESFSSLQTPQPRDDFKQLSIPLVFQILSILLHQFKNLMHHAHVRYERLTNADHNQGTAPQVLRLAGCLNFPAWLLTIDVHLSI